MNETENQLIYFQTLTQLIGVLYVDHSGDTALRQIAKEKAEAVLFKLSEKLETGEA